MTWTEQDYVVARDRCREAWERSPHQPQMSLGELDETLVPVREAAGAGVSSSPSGFGNIDRPRPQVMGDARDRGQRRRS